MLKVWKAIKHVINVLHKAIMVLVHVTNLFNGTKRKPFWMKAFA